MLGLMGLYDYMRIGDDLKDMNPLDWSREQLKTIKAGKKDVPGGVLSVENISLYDFK